MSSEAPAGGRIQVLPAALADQIAAGEVVERPASVVKELVENAIDAGAKRVDVEIEGGGLTRIRVVDDGRGMDPEDLRLAITRHATSKIREPQDLVEIHTLGFRGEALASVAAVATVDIRSRTQGATVGAHLRSLPGEPGRAEPVGMGLGTVVEVVGLFAAVPARRKFMRTEATEVGHCSDVMLRMALVQPDVHFTLTHGKRRILDLPAGPADARMTQVLGRRARGPFPCITGERDGVRVQAWLGSPTTATRSTRGIHVIVRRRVVKEKNLTRIVSQAYGEALEAGHHPVACLLVEPPPGTVDVNVHPQKAEVRFSDPQTVFAAVRQVLAEGMADLRWGAPPPERPTVEPPNSLAPTPERASTPERAPQGANPRPYRLGTRAADQDYRTHKVAMQSELEGLRSLQRLGSQSDRGATVRPADARAVDSSAHATKGSTAADAATDSGVVGPSYVGCLAGPVALFVEGADLLAVDLRRLRTHLVHRRLIRELGTEGIASQRLLSPIVVRLEPAEVEACEKAREGLLRLALDVERFGEDAVVVRGVPARLEHCVEESDVTELVQRLLPWVHLWSADRRDGADTDALQVMAAASGPDPAPRLARRWVDELVREGVDLATVPGIRRWSGRALAGEDG